jgi:hypothetical protein
VLGSEAQIASNTMVALSRRSFLASSVSVGAHPALAIPASSAVDVIIVGAGAAGIAGAGPAARYDRAADSGERPSHVIARRVAGTAPMAKQAKWYGLGPTSVDRLSRAEFPIGCRPVPITTG